MIAEYEEEREIGIGGAVGGEGGGGGRVKGCMNGQRRNDINQ